MEINDIEQKFKRISGFDESVDLSIFPYEEDLQTEINKEKSDEHGEVFTPINLVDKMLSKKDDDYWRDHKKFNCDLCAGYGQFTVRILRKKINLDPKFDIAEYLKNYHWFTEYQLSSCLKLIYIFGQDINLLIGDSCQMISHKGNVGIYYFNDDEWWPVKDTIKSLFEINNVTLDTDFEKLANKLQPTLDECFVKQPDMFADF